MPRVYVYPCMDSAHAALLRARHVRSFFDPDLGRNQYISEYALHRSLLASPQRVEDPTAADFHFMPFYSRLAYADKKAAPRVRRLQANLTSALASCLRSSAAWRSSRGMGRAYVGMHAHAYVYAWHAYVHARMQLASLARLSSPSRRPARPLIRSLARPPTPKP